MRVARRCDHAARADSEDAITVVAARLPVGAAASSTGAPTP